MADTAAPATAAASATPKKSKAGASKKPKVKPSHPPTSSMVKKAIKDLKERGGSSLQAIKKFISATYKIDAEKISPFIRKYLKNAVASGELVQTKGKGASGSFKLASAAKAEKPAGAPKKAAKKSAAAKAKKAAPKTPKKAAKKPTAKPKKSPSKAKKIAKAPTKPKAPKPKKVAKKSPKKAAPKRK